MPGRPVAQAPVAAARVVLVAAARRTLARDADVTVPETSLATGIPYMVQA
jgi:hypothetical protein